MGHYASEMISDKEYEDREKRKKMSRLNTEKKISDALSEPDGLVRVLADIVENNSIKYK